MLPAWRGALLGTAGVLVCAAMIAARPALPDPAVTVPAERWVTVTGVGAGSFDPAIWRRGRLHFVRDTRWPILMPREGAYRNIYAPTLIRDGRGYRVYFGGWDGSPDPHDRLYSTTTDADFGAFTPHRLVVDHGPFIHVNNGSAWRLPNGRVYLMGTTYPDARGTNKPALWTSRDGLHFGDRLPAVARQSDWVTIAGYPQFEGADINGMNVLLREGRRWRLFFGDFKQWGYVYRASGTDARRLRYDGPVLDEGLMVNDVKLFRTAGDTEALMLLHHNGDSLRYSLSPTTARFPPTRTLFESAGPEDRYIVSAGWVTDGRRLLGVLYGAGPVPTLDHNRIFARWLQKRLRFETAQGDAAVDGSAAGPDRFRFAVPGGAAPDGAPDGGPTGGAATAGRFIIYAEDGETELFRSPEVQVRPGDVWRLAGGKGRWAITRVLSADG